MPGWIKTDDLQYVNHKKDGIYEIVEARYAEGRYIVCKGTVIISNWLDSDGNYDSDCARIITAYYDSVRDFTGRYLDEDTREQVLAEMIFEETAYWETDVYEIVSEDEVENKINEYMNMQ